MDLSQETSKDEGDARTSSSRSGEAGQDDKEVQKQRAGSGDEDEDDDGGDDEGTRQPYKCTFCRRGFPTAQALGGHMNVHRRHRGRSAAAAPTAGAAAAEQPPYYSTTVATVVAFGQTRPASGGALSSRAERQRPYELRLFGRDCAAGGGRRSNKEGGGNGDVRRDRCGYERDGDGGGDHGGGEELDLELRLGGTGP